MYALTQGDTLLRYPYTVEDLKRDNPSISFPAQMSPDLLAEWGVFRVQSAPLPEYDPFKERMEEGAPVFSSGTWVRAWEKVQLSEQEAAQYLEAHQETVRRQRLSAYRDEADPLYFKWQRGEATQYDWLNKIAEIKERFPMPVVEEPSAEEPASEPDET
jgi:hypothetical protein